MICTFCMLMALLLETRYNIDHSSNRTIYNKSGQNVALECYIDLASILQVQLDLTKTFYKITWSWSNLKFSYFLHSGFSIIRRRRWFSRLWKWTAVSDVGFFKFSNNTRIRRIHDIEWISVYRWYRKSHQSTHKGVEIAAKSDVSTRES